MIPDFALVLSLWAYAPFLVAYVWPSCANIVSYKTGSTLVLCYHQKRTEPWQACHIKSTRCISNLLVATTLILLLIIVSQTTWPAPLLQRRRCTASSDVTRMQLSTSTFNWWFASALVTAICYKHIRHISVDFMLCRVFCVLACILTCH